MTDRTEGEGLEPQATVSRLPWRNGDGYSYGGEVILTVGERAFLVGASREDEAFARDMASAWNSRPTEALAGKGEANDAR